MFRRSSDPGPSHAESRAHRYPSLAGTITGDDGRAVSYQLIRLPLGAGLMFGAGTLSALLGIGSGVLKIPAMDVAMKLPIKVSSATASMMIGVTACGAAAAYLLSGTLDLELSAPVVLGSLAGSVLGAKILVRATGPSLRVAFATVLLALAVPMTANAFGMDWAITS